MKKVLRSGKRPKRKRDDEEAREQPAEWRIDRMLVGVTKIE